MLHDVKLSIEMKTETLESLLQLLDDFYVFPDVANNIRTEFSQKVVNGSYHEVTTASAFCELVTKDLRAISKDKHLNVCWSKDVLPPRKVEESTAEFPESLKTQFMLDNYGFAKVERLPGNIGYLELHSFVPPEFAGETAVSAMNFLANTSGLMIDLRKNRGGSSFMVVLLASYLLESTHAVAISEYYWRHYKITQSFWNMPYVSGKRFGGKKPVCILTSEQTFSGAEEFAYSLQALKRASVIGETTGGGANPGWMHRINDHFEVFIPNAHAINPITKDSWEGKGVTPDIEVSQEDAFEAAYITLLKQGLEQMMDHPIPGQDKLSKEIRTTLENLIKK
ncbi:S41 family peptidase [Paenibacillus qinlingensis]|uniref:C-terminal processing protease CtpA/Prc n=1 Tax=Paenibacillus qinlingensis TaxID=1837343 RepID=A0ABU1NW09_9BACL|nr:S41 family peptidase [Paenibacillus qinlingensis]MDR6551648.1 C-terminal processing protease CtpA/Prc [Paenibacillus qinlingensis]